MASNLRTLLLLIIVLMLTGCATGYGPQGMTGGYKERKLDEGRYIVSFFGNGHTTEQLVWNFWLYRCAELTSQNGYDFFEILPSANHALGNENENAYQFTMIPSTLEFASEGGVKPVAYTTYTITTYSSKAIVQMYKNPVPQSAKFLLDAKLIMSLLKPYIDSNGKTTPPERKDLMIRATVEAAIKSNKIKPEDSNVLDKKLRQSL